MTPPVPPATLWTETVLHNFKNGNDGCRPDASLIFDSSGALYGTTAGGGINGGNGTVFTLMPPAPPATKWTETVLYSFMGGNDGRDPVAGLIFNSNGVLYGTTQLGGTGICSTPPTKDICGTVFKLKPPVPPATNWTEKVLYSFQGGSDGYMPMAGLILNSNGALFGTTQLGGGPANSGTVFKLKPPVPPATTWTEKVLYSFKGGSDGAQPFAGLIFDSHGALYGTTGFGGGLPDAGTVFKLTPPVPPATLWTETVLHSFPGGFGLHQPLAGLIFDTKGALYGTTIEGGTSNEGTVFKVTP
ncbi:MAG: choice-of-anchor tandem repeat GloVer-containing protein [Methylocella sp.]